MRFWNSDTSFFFLGDEGCKVFLTWQQKKTNAVQKNKNVRTKFLKSPYFREWVTAG
jgi:hypothetical protein